MNQEEIDIIEYFEAKALEELFEAIENNNIEKVKKLVENRAANINAKYVRFHHKYNNKYALIIASERENWEMVKYLVEHGADVNYEYKDGYNKFKTALIIASSHGYLEIVRYLVEHGADVNYKYEDDYNKTVLMLASMRGKLGVVKCLVENGADINAKDKDGKTALIYALINRQLRIVAYFIEKGVNINARYDYGENNIGMTILMIASKRGYLEIVKYLARKKADVNLEDYKCDTALDFAKNAKNNEAIIGILRDYGAM